jgi:hypothetical protein
MSKFKVLSSLFNFAAVVALVAILGLLSAGAQTPSPKQSDSVLADLIGAVVFAADGTEVGEVSAITTVPGGEISEIRITAASPLGIGERVVVIPKGSFMTLRGAVVLDMTPDEFDSMPSAGARGSGINPASGRDSARALALPRLPA